jgi:hypothetical protein
MYKYLDAIGTIKGAMEWGGRRENKKSGFFDEEGNHA